MHEIKLLEHDVILQSTSPNFTWFNEQLGLKLNFLPQDKDLILVFLNIPEAVSVNFDLISASN